LEFWQEPFLANKKKTTTPADFAGFLIFERLPSPKPVMIPYFHGQLPVPPDVQDPSQITIPSELRTGNSGFFTNFKRKAGGFKYVFKHVQPDPWGNGSNLTIFF